MFEGDFMCFLIKIKDGNPVSFKRKSEGPCSFRNCNILWLIFCYTLLQPELSECWLSVNKC